MRCQFAERQYEFYLNNELTSRALVFIPDPRFEYYLAVDAATFTTNHRLWQLWYGWQFWRHRPGIDIGPELWDLAEHELRDRTFPQLKCNLFLQYKRPEFITRDYRSNAHQHWQRSYYKYEIEKHQQDILSRLEQRASSDALVVYACPAFHTWNELIAARGRIIDNSNFTEPHEMQGHSKNTFIAAGRDGFACSGPHRYKRLDILEKLKSLSKKEVQYEDNVEFIHAIAKHIRSLVKEVDEKRWSFLFDTVDEGRRPETKFARSVVTIANFTLYSNTTWGLVYTHSADKQT
jgi:hypothetical protein